MKLFVLQHEDGEKSAHLSKSRKTAEQYVSEYPGTNILREVDVIGTVRDNTSLTKKLIEALVQLSALTDDGEIKHALEHLAFAAWQDGQKSAEEAK